MSVYDREWLGTTNITSKEEELAKLEQETRKKKIGSWSQQNPVASWDFWRK